MDNPFEALSERLSNIEKSLFRLEQNISLNPGSVPDQDQWFDIDSLCEYLPDRPARSTIYKNIKDIPHHKGKKKLIFLKSEIDAWLKEGRRLTNSEIKEQAQKYIADKL